MKVAHNIGGAFAGLVAVFGICGGVVISSLHSSVSQFNRDQEIASLAFEYERGALREQAGAYMMAERSPEMGRQNLAEGTRAMQTARARFASVLEKAEDRAAIDEMARVEVLANHATDELVRHVEARADDVKHLQVLLRVVEARVQTLLLHTATLSARTKAMAAQSLQTVQAVQSKVLFSVGIALLVAILTGLALGRRISRPIRALLHGVARIRDGDLAHRIALRTTDEFGGLADAFDGMSETLQKAMLQLEQRTLGMQLVLSNVGQGLVTVDRAGSMAAERSRVLEQWFGKPAAGARLWEYLAPRAPNVSSFLEVGWDGLNDGFLPLDVSIDQLPKRLVTEGRSYNLEYRPILEGQELAQVLVVISDVTDKVHAERIGAEQRTLLATFERIMRDKSGFLDFCEEARDIVQRIGSGAASLSDLKRDIHTLKGNAGMFQLTGIAEYCHALEDKLSENGDQGLAPGDSAGLGELWDAFSARVQRMLGPDRQVGITIEDTEYAEILLALTRGLPRSELAIMIAQWKYESARVRLERLGEQATALAKRMGKGPLDVRIDGGGVRLPKEEWSPFWSALVHVLRNAVDHGLQAPEARAAAGKDPMAHLTLRSALEAGNVIIEIADDGAGIAWEKVRERARARGLPHETSSDLQAALFAEGLSTRDTVSETSGRGVGMSAVLIACKQLGGRVSVQSDPGKGTTMRFIVPNHARAMLAGVGPIAYSRPPPPPVGAAA
jgi:two-component system chemotaxis sensor kinase CheA